MTIQPAISNPLSARLTPRIVFIPHVRIDGGRLRTAHSWYASVAKATTKNRGCRRSSQNKQPALNSPTKPSPARTCGSTHQLGVSRAAITDRTPTPLGSVFIGTIIKPLAHSVVNSAAAGEVMETIDVCYVIDEGRST